MMKQIRIIIYMIQLFQMEQRLKMALIEALIMMLGMI